MQQQSAGDAGDIDRAFRSAASLLRLGSREQRGAVVTPSYRIGDCQDPNHFPQHPAIGPKTATVLDRSPDGGPRVNRIDTAKDCIPGCRLRSEAVRNRLHIDSPDRSAELPRL